MGVQDSQPATLNMQEAVITMPYARHTNVLRSTDFELYAIDIQDYFVNFPGPSQYNLHKDCDPVVEMDGSGSRQCLGYGEVVIPIRNVNIVM